MQVLCEKLDEDPRIDANSRLKKYIKVGSAVLVEVMHCSWIIYGNSLYFSSDNDCPSKTGSISYMMLVILIVGFFSLLVYGVLIIIAICFIIARCRGK